MASRHPWPLKAYRFLTAIGVPAAEWALHRRKRRGKEHPERIGERRGRSSVQRPPGPLVWVHGASVGEMLSVLPLIERIRSRGFTVLVTAGTMTAAELASRRLPPGAIHQFAPLDIPQFVGRFLNHWKPSLALFVESDLWPNLIVAAAARKIPMVLVNGRLSERSFNRWMLLPRTIGSLLSRFDLCLAQSADDASRYADLGAPRYITTGNLKLDVPALPADSSHLWQMQTAIGARPMVLAASTHPGEEEYFIDAHRRLKAAFPRLLTVLVPRHPERGADLVRIVQGAGLRLAQRSRGELPNPDTDIYVADTLGELGLFYRVAPIVFMGGSLVRHGGQNPIEPAKLGAAILHGPHVWNFTEVYAALDGVRGAEQVADPAQLTARLGAWLKDSDLRGRVAQAGQRSMETLTGALDRTMAALDPYLMPVYPEQGSGSAVEEGEPPHA